MMNATFTEILSEDGKKNSLGRVNDVIELVLNEPVRLEELYSTIFHEDAWVRMRAVDAYEKICRVHPEWFLPYIDRIQNELAQSSQASIRWHVAQIYRQVLLNNEQKSIAIKWLIDLVNTTSVDWIVAVNAIDSLAYFTHSGDFYEKDLRKVLAIQQHHKSSTVVRSAAKLLVEFS